MTHEAREQTGEKRRKIKEQWAEIKEWNQRLSPAHGVRVYCEALDMDDPLEEAVKHFRLHRGDASLEGVIGDLISRGARLERTEDPFLYRLCGQLLYLGELVGSLPESEVKDQLDSNLEELCTRACEERDRFIAKRIAETLKEGEMGLLYVGAGHQVENYLPGALEVSVWNVFDRIA